MDWFLPGASCYDRVRRYEPGKGRVTAQWNSDTSGSSIARAKTRFEFHRRRTGAHRAIIQWTIAFELGGARRVAAVEISLTSGARWAFASGVISDGLGNEAGKLNRTGISVGARVVRLRET